MCSPMIDNSDDGSLCEIIILKKELTTPIITFLYDYQNIQSILLMSPLLQFCCSCCLFLEGLFGGGGGGGGGVFL